MGDASLPPHPFVFVSYASVDRAQVLAIADDLRAAGLQLWIDQAGIAGGTSYGTEIATALKESAAVALMCSAASLASRNVRQEIMLAWRYDRPILPLLLEPTTFPDDVAYWLEGAQWIEVLQHPASTWLPSVGRALARHGITVVLPRASARDDAASDPASTSGLQLEVPNNLPLPESPLIGRDREVQEVLTLLANGRWVTLTGTGGTGKTRLALEVARRLAPGFVDGAYWVDLAATTDPELVLPVIAAALNLPEDPTRSIADVLRQHLAGRRILLVLDNLEQIAQAASQVAALEAESPDLVVIATSRVSLRVPGEWVYDVGQLLLPPLDPLPAPATLGQNPAVRLFVDRAKEARRDFVLTDGNAAAVAQICHRVDGLPLAIELAAARVRLLPPAAIMTRLGSRLGLLTRGSALAARQQTLRDTIAWSYGLLAPAEQAAFRRLAVFAGGATVDDAEAILTAVPTADAALTPGLDDLAALIDHSLLRAEPGARDTPRVRMLETIREYAQEQLTAANEAGPARTLHAERFLSRVVDLQDDLRGPAPGPALSDLRAEDDNLRAALDTFADRQPDDPDADAELRLAGLLLNYWRRLGRFAEAQTRLDRAIARHPKAPPSLRAQALKGAGFLSARRGDLPTAIRLYGDALTLWQESGDRAGEADTRNLLARSLERTGDFAAARLHLESELSIRRELNDRAGIAVALHDLGMNALYAGDSDTAQARLAEALPFYRATADARNIAIALHDLGIVEMLTSQMDAAIAHQTEAIALWRTLDDRYGLATCLATAGRALLSTNRPHDAARLWDEALTIFRELGDTAGTGLALYGLGMVAITDHDLDRAKALLSESLPIAQAAGEPRASAYRLEGFAAYWFARADAARAARLLGAAAALRAANNVPLPEIEADILARLAADIEAALGTDHLTQEQEIGRAAPLDTMFAEALGESVI